MSAISLPGSEIFAQARQVLAGGVFASMRLSPSLDTALYTGRGEGPYLHGIDGRRYLDFDCSNGATLLGHDHLAVREALLEGVDAGVNCAAETPFHAALAARIVEIIPAAERVRFSSVGSEVTLVALRIARAATGRTRYLKFDGHFHGLTEPWLFKREDPLGDDVRTVSSSTGVQASMGEAVIIVPWNDAVAFERVMAEQGDQVAAVFCEPSHYTAGSIPPAPGSWNCCVNAPASTA
ncbi:MAG: aminotransferase class III-fold pyridoxal phosphate-dependent enzyme [Thermomicrobiales bacterium]